MRKLAYSKYSGAGNTFFLINNLAGLPIPSPSVIAALCRNPINKADGIIFLESSKTADARMRIYNADGSEAEMCGNGLRACVKFLEELGLRKDPLHLESLANPRHIAYCVANEVSVSMGDPHGMKWNIPFTLGDISKKCHFINTGVPHTIFFLESLKTLMEAPVKKWGQQVRFDPFFSPSGTNVNFAYLLPDNTLSLRTYERGVEDETLACGTGATATALAAAYLYNLPSPIKVHTRSTDELLVQFKKKSESFSEIFLQGPAQKIGEGVFDLIF